MTQNATASTATNKKATTKKTTTKKATKTAQAVQAPVVAPVVDRRLVLLSNTFLEQQRALYKQYKAKREADKKPLSKADIAKYAENVKRIATYIVAGKKPRLLWPSDKLDQFSELIVVLALDNKKGVRRVRYGVC